jgi:hypothetical protein
MHLIDFACLLHWSRTFLHFLGDVFIIVHGLYDFVFPLLGN